MSVPARHLRVAPSRGPGRPAKDSPSMLRRVVAFTFSPAGLAATAAGVATIAALRARAQQRRAESELLAHLREKEARR